MRLHERLRNDLLTKTALGSWYGEGEHDGIHFEVRRRWELTLWDRFLCVNIENSRAKSSSGLFVDTGLTALAYWQELGEHRYQVAWLTGWGTLGIHEGLYVPQEDHWVLNFKKDGNHERRWILTFTSDGKSTEEIQTLQQDDWKTVGRFTLNRES